MHPDCFSLNKYSRGCCSSIEKTMLQSEMFWMPFRSPVLGDIIFAFGRIQMIRINGSNPKKLMVLVLSTMVSFF